MVEKRQALGRNLNEPLSNAELTHRVSDVESVVGSSIPNEDRVRSDADTEALEGLNPSRSSESASNLQESPLSIRPALNGSGNVLCLEQDTSRGTMFTTRGLGRFVQYLDKVTSPTIIDLGPAIGSSVAFFGERLGGKLIVEDLFTELEHAAGHTDPENNGLVSLVNGRLAHQAGSIDGVLCWDVFDHLDLAAAESLAQQIIRILKPGGAVFALFFESKFSERYYTKYAIVDTDHLESRTYSATRSKTRWWGSLDVYKLFHGLTIGETYLLKVQIREMLFQKPRLATGF